MLTPGLSLRSLWRLQILAPVFELPMPTKKLFSSKERDQLLKRRAEIQAFIDAILAVPALQHMLAFKQFCLDQDYLRDFEGV